MIYQVFKVRIIDVNNKNILAVPAITIVIRIDRENEQKG